MISLDDILYRAWNTDTPEDPSGLGGIKLSDIHFRAWQGEGVIYPDPPPEPPPDPEDPPPEPPPGFEGSLAARPRIADSTGDEYFISPTGNDSTGTGSISSPWRTPNKAFSVVPYGSQIWARGGTYNLPGDTGGGGQQNWNRTGGSASEVTKFSSYTGEWAQFVGGARFIVGGGSWIRFERFGVSGSLLEGVKITDDAHHVDLSRLWIDSVLGNGILITGSGTSDYQIWDTILSNNGTNNFHHGIYASVNNGSSVIGNCLIYNSSGLGVQLYPNCDNMWLVCSTIDQQVRDPYGAGMVIGGDIGFTSQGNKVVGCLFTNNRREAVHQYLPTGNPPVMNQVEDCMGYNNGTTQEWEQSWGAYNGINYVRVHSDTNPLYVNPASRNYRLQAGSPAIDAIDAANHGFVPIYDIEGNVRASATMGCYAKNA